MRREETPSLERARDAKNYKSITRNAMVSYRQASFEKIYGGAFRIERVHYVRFLFVLLMFSLACGQLEAQILREALGKLKKVRSKSMLGENIHETRGYSLHDLEKIGVGQRKSAFAMSGIDHSVLIMLNDAPNFRGSLEEARQLLTEQFVHLKKLRKIGVPTPRFGRLLSVANTSTIGGRPELIPMQQMERVSMILQDAALDVGKLRRLAPHKRRLKRQLAEILKRMNRAKMVADDLHVGNLGVIFDGRTPNLVVIDPVISFFHPSLKDLKKIKGDSLFKTLTSIDFFTHPIMRQRWDAARALD